jgi:hypothetical protein
MADQEGPTGQPGWSGEPDCERLTARGFRRFRYEDVPTVFADYYCVAYPCRSGTYRIRILRPDQMTARDEKFVVPWETGVVLLRRNYMAAGLDAHGYARAVSAGNGAYAASRLAAAEIARLGQAVDRFEPLPGGRGIYAQQMARRMKGSKRRGK